MLRRFHCDETGQGLVEYLLSIAVLTRATVSSIRNGTVADLLIGACILIALAFVVFWLLDHD